MRKGWHEERTLTLYPVFGADGFAGVQRVGELKRYRYHKQSGKEEVQTHYVITSLRPHEASVEEVLAYIRAHWTIENNLHRTRDVQMKEDSSRIRRDRVPQLLAALSNAIIGLLKRNGYDSVKEAAETFCANPKLACTLLTGET